MNVIKTDIEGVLILEPKVFYDARGYFFESYNERDFNALVGNVNFIQDNESRSQYGCFAVCISKRRTFPSQARESCAWNCL